ncbi:MAG TPA: recombinase family protein [Bryobacteraceae bacterium]|nr:recombinase family protein [Bryobacteraceae bacterium]
MRAAIYARVSKEKCNLCSHPKSDHTGGGTSCTAHPHGKDKPCTCVCYSGQDPQNQIAVLKRYCLDSDWEPVVYIDYESGNSSDRAQFQKLFQDSGRHEFGMVLVWALDRFTREGVAETFIHIQKLLRYKVQFESFSEPHFRTTGPMGELMIAIAAWIAKQERIRISERTKAGLAVARNKGKVLGRPVKVFARWKVLADRKRGMSWPALAKKYGISSRTIRRVVKKLDAAAK